MIDEKNTALEEDEKKINNINLEEDEEEEDAGTVVKFKTPYVFEGETYNTIDLAGLDSLTAKDMMAAEKWLAKKKVFSAIPEMALEYVCFIAHKASGLPLEFFDGLPPRNMEQIKVKITNFFYGED